MVPMLPVVDHVGCRVSAELETTVAENCWLLPRPTVMSPGLIVMLVTVTDLLTRRTTTDDVVSAMVLTVTVSPRSGSALGGVTTRSNVPSGASSKANRPPSRVVAEVASAATAVPTGVIWTTAPSTVALVPPDRVTTPERMVGSGSPLLLLLLLFPPVGSSGVQPIRKHRAMPSRPAHV